MKIPVRFSVITAVSRSIRGLSLVAVGTFTYARHYCSLDVGLVQESLALQIRHGMVVLGAGIICT